MARKINVLNQHQVNKEILAKPVKERFEYELLGPFNRYRDENYDIYKKKKEEMLKAADEYRKQNKAALFITKPKLEHLHYGSINCDFENDLEGEVELDVGICCIEPWFRRYLILGKFIRAVRNIIIKKRLLKNLEILKKLDSETIEILEKCHKKCENVSYASLFEKFLL